MSNPSQDIALYDNDLYIADGDLQIVASDVQHVYDTIAAFPGWWKQFPPDGVGILQYINSVGQAQTLARSARLQLKSDGYSISNPDIQIDPSGILTINPNAIKN